MKYNNVVKAEFVSRPNRFIAIVRIDGKEETVHVKNTGRCRELLVPDAAVYLARGENPARKTKYDLIAVEKRMKDGSTVLINMDSSLPNDVAGEWLKVSGLFSENAVIRREVTYGASRFDFYIEDGERKMFLEVKGCTLENDGIASFPDAPTERGVRHLNELVDALGDGFEAAILFIVQMKGVSFFHPADSLHPEFGRALRRAAESGVKVMAVDCMVSPDEVIADSEVRVDLEYKEKENK